MFGIELSGGKKNSKMFLGQFLSFEQWEEKEIKKFLEKELDTLSRDEKDQKSHKQTLQTHWQRQQRFHPCLLVKRLIFKWEFYTWRKIPKDLEDLFSVPTVVKCRSCASQHKKKTPKMSKYTKRNFHNFSVTPKPQNFDFISSAVTFRHRNSHI